MAQKKDTDSLGASIKTGKTSKILKSFPFGFVLGFLSFGVGEHLYRYAGVISMLASEQSKTLYAFGQLSAQKMDGMRLSALEAEVVTLGIRDWLGKKPERVEFANYRTKLQDLLEKRRAEQIQVAKQEGQAYSEKFLKSGGLRSISGLVYKIIQPGSSKKPTLKNWVEVSYRGSLISGKVIDGTTEENPNTKLPMNGVIAGWTEGLQLIGEGGEVELVVPSDLAYGDYGTATEVVPGATLHFHIKLNRVLDSAGR